MGVSGGVRLWCPAGAKRSVLCVQPINSWCSLSLNAPDAVEILPGGTVYIGEELNREIAPKQHFFEVIGDSDAFSRVGFGAVLDVVKAMVFEQH